MWVTNVHYRKPVFALHTAVLTKSESIRGISKQIKTPSHIANVFFYLHHETTNLRSMFSIFLLFQLLWRRIRKRVARSWNARNREKEKKKGGGGGVGKLKKKNWKNAHVPSAWKSIQIMICWSGEYITTWHVTSSISEPRVFSWWQCNELCVCRCIWRYLKISLMMWYFVR
jgi:hypothetical protein